MNTEIENIKLLRFVGFLLPLKSKLNFLINKYFKKDNFLQIPFEKDYSICIQPHQDNHSTINEFIFLGSAYLPESTLFGALKKSLPDNYHYVDVGSNLGTTILKMYHSNASIIGFEPMPHLYQAIEETIKQNNFKNVKIINKAVGNETGIVKMVLNDNSSIVDANDSNTNFINVPITTLDSELETIDRLDILKIDVEGFEWQVLQGATNIIKKFHPKLLIELHPSFLKGYSIDINNILDFLENSNYKIDYYSFLQELRLPKLSRFLSRYSSNKGKRFSSREEFIVDTHVEPIITSYHIFCQ